MKIIPFEALEKTLIKNLYIACFYSNNIAKNFIDKEKLSGIHINEYGFKTYYKDGKLHRDDGPAREGKDGYKEWYKAGKLHRKDGPAVTHPAGLKGWYLNGQHWYPSASEQVLL